VVLGLVLGPRPTIVLIGAVSFQSPPDPGPVTPTAHVDLDIVGEVDITAVTVVAPGGVVAVGTQVVPGAGRPDRVAARDGGSLPGEGRRRR
jgi:hypothetical protein